MSSFNFSQHWGWNKMKKKCEKCTRVILFLIDPIYFLFKLFSQCFSFIFQPNTRKYNKKIFKIFRLIILYKKNHLKNSHIYNWRWIGCEARNIEDQFSGGELSSTASFPIAVVSISVMFLFLTIMFPLVFVSVPFPADKNYFSQFWR